MCAIRAAYLVSIMRLVTVIKNSTTASLVFPKALHKVSHPLAEKIRLEHNICLYEKAITLVQTNLRFRFTAFISVMHLRNS